MGKRNTYSPEYKSKIVIEVLEGEKTISEIAAREELNENMLKNWKKEFVENASRAFSTAKDEREARKAQAAAKAKEEEYQKTIGQLTVQVNWLKKKSDEMLGPGWQEKYGYIE